jgi:uncharacterized membrane protein (Fun14 family)
MTQTERSTTRRAPVKEFVTHLVEMPAWHRKTLVLAGVLAVAGLVGQAMSRVSHPPPVETRASEPVASNGAPRSSAFATDSSPAPIAATADQPAPPEPTTFERLAPWASRLGIGFIGGFIIGWAFRAFLKTMALVTAAGVALIWTLSHFNVLHLDMDAAEERFKSSTSWVSNKAEQLKDSAMTLIPSSASSVFGMFLGFRRR